MQQYVDPSPDQAGRRRAPVHGRPAGWTAVAVSTLLVLAGCTTEQPDVADEPDRTRSSPAASPAASSPAAPATSSSGTAVPDPSPAPTAAVRFDAAAAMADVRRLAGRIGPRLATGPAFRDAGRLVAARFERHGYRTARQRFDVPAGDSWGVPVRAGRSFNVVATPPGFDASRPHVVLGAHLDTVAVAPGAEDNASGVAVLLDLARLAARQQPRLPTVFVAFGAEEPRGSGDDLHHFGSRHYVAQMSRVERRALRAMVSLDRVGVGRIVPVCTGPLSPQTVRDAILRAARSLDVPTRTCQNTASDHWSFEKAGFPVARLGSTSYAAYHSAADLPGVVSRRQLGRTGHVAWAWLSG